MLLAILLTSCTIGRETRRKARAERKLDRALALYPDLAKTRADTVSVPVVFRDTVIVPGGSADLDTVISISDTIYITEEVTGARISIITAPYRQRIGELATGLDRYRDSLLHLQVLLDVPPKVVYRDTTIYVEVPVSTTVIRRSFWNRMLMGIRRWWWILIAASIVILVVTYAQKMKP